MERSVNNQMYANYGARWYLADDDPIALLRAESRSRSPWVAAEIERTLGKGARRVLDVGCGGGFLSNYLATAGHHVTGLDAAQDALDVAAHYDRTRSVRYERGDALHLPYESGSFDVVCAMDFLEHVSDPEAVVREAARVLAPSGLFVFHTFNRNWLSWLVVIKGVEWFVANTPRDLHVLPLFLKPEELEGWCARHALEHVALRGSRPVFGAAFWKMLLTGSVPADFAFTFTRSLKLAYTGSARKALPL